MILGMFSSMGTAKGLDMADAKFNFSGLYPKASSFGGMSVEDAQRYNQFMDNGSQCDFTNAEKFGFTKLDEINALNKVDLDELLKIQKYQNNIEYDLFNNPNTLVNHSNTVNNIHKFGLNADEFNNLKLKNIDLLSQEQVDVIKGIRDLEPPITNNTVIRKFIPESDIEKYIGENGWKQIGGYIASDNDVAHINGYNNVRDSLRLDYKLSDGSMPYPDNGNAYGYIKFKTDEVNDIGIPYGKRFGGTNTDGAPCTQNVYLGSRNGEIIPEWYANNRVKPKFGAELHKVVNGKDNIVAIFNNKYFVKID